MATTTQPPTGESVKRLVNYRREGGVAVIEMNDPPANAYSYEMNRQLDEAILEARMDNDAYVIVLTGAGPAFCDRPGSVGAYGKVATQKIDWPNGGRRPPSRRRRTGTNNRS